MLNYRPSGMHIMHETSRCHLKRIILFETLSYVHRQVILPSVPTNALRQSRIHHVRHS